MLRCFVCVGSVVIVAIAGCGDDDGMTGGDAGTAGATARFDPEPGAGGALDVGAVPWPSDLFVDDEGHPRIGALLENDDDPRTIELRRRLSFRRGLCGSCNAYFRIDGALDPASVPVSASAFDSATATDAIVMADVTPESPDRGRLFPLRVELDAARGVLAVRPVRGIVLLRDRTYAVAVTSALRAMDGTPLAPSQAFVEVRDGTGGSAAVARARAILGPALDVLSEIGLARERVVSLAAFTVGDPTLTLSRARELVHAAPAPIATVDRVWDTPEEIDSLMGVPGEDRPGIDVPAAAGTEGAYGMRHATVGAVIAGRFLAPRLVEGTGSDIGAARRDETGALVAGPLEDVPFVLIVPTAADPGSLPVVVHHHGFNASRITGFVYADTAGAAGAAVLSIDAFQHGDRAATQADELLNVRSLAGADGFAETDMLEVSGRVFGVTGAPAGMELFPGYPLAAFIQFTSDVMMAVRLVREGDISAIVAASPALAGLAFDPDRILYAGNSMGSVVGVGVLSAESDIGAYAMNVQVGSMVETLAEGAQFRPLSEGVFLPLLDVRGRFDEVTRSVVFHPTIDLFRWVMEPVDPLALAPYLFEDRVAGGATPDLLMQLASLDELAAPPATQSMLAAAGIPGTGELEHAPVEAATLPLSGNAGDHTRGAVRFDPAAHGTLEIAAQPSSYAPPLVPPLIERPEPISVENPIAAIHDQIELFFRTRIENGRAEIR